RTPLNMVIGYTSSMLDMPSMYNGVRLPDVYADDVRTIQDSGNHLLSLINDVLDLSKVEAGKMSLNFDAVNLNEVFHGVIATSTGLVGNKPVQVRADYPDNLPMIWGDGLRVRQILLNLMSNAVKFTEAGSVTLSAKTEADAVLIAVRDTGLGIPEKSLDTLFSRFDQVRNKDGYRGTGLGLEISQELAKLHGTKIEVSSKLGQGSTFSIRFPIATSEQIQDEGQPADIAPDDAVVLDGEAMPIGIAVLMTDHLTTRQTARRALTSENYDVVDAESFEIGYDMATALLPDVVLVDLDLVRVGELNTLLHELRDDPATAHTSVLVLGDLNEVPPNVATVVAKPLEVDALRRELTLPGSISTEFEQ
ncbi:MAG: HAMP domain-containing sensor histidine kinase, partial [Chloroflexota bacterium]